MTRCNSLFKKVDAIYVSTSWFAYVTVKDIFPRVDFFPLWVCSMSRSLEHEYQYSEYIIAILQ